MSPPPAELSHAFFTPHQSRLCPFPLPFPCGWLTPPPPAVGLGLGQAAPTPYMRLDGAHHTNPGHWIKTSVQPSVKPGTGYLAGQGKRLSTTALTCSIHRAMTSAWGLSTGWKI